MSMLIVKLREVGGVPTACKLETLARKRQFLRRWQEASTTQRYIQGSVADYSNNNWFL